MIDLAESLQDIVIEELGKHLEKNVKGLRQFIHGFPEANIKAKYPGISAHITSDRKQNCHPYIYSQGDTTANKAVVKYVVGNHDIKIQIDLWERTKEELNDLHEKFEDAMLPNIPDTGLVLNLEDYHNNTCEYTMVNSTPKTREGESTRKHWRMTIDVVSNCKAIKEKSEYIISTIETHQTIGQSSTELEADTNLEITTIP